MLKILLLTAFFGSAAFALDDASLLSSQLKKILSEKIPGAEIRIPNLDKLVKTAEISAIKELSSVRMVEDRSTGVAVFELFSTTGETTKVQTPYQAWIKVPVAVRRIYPNTKLKKEDFRIDTVNVAVAPARDYRGIMIGPDVRLDQMESKQTILENQFVVTSAVYKQPDLRKGEMVKLELISGDLILTASAVAQENASVGEKIHVLTNKTKKEIIGKVTEDHTVEVKL